MLLNHLIYLLEETFSCFRDGGKFKRLSTSASQQAPLNKILSIMVCTTILFSQGMLNVSDLKGLSTSASFNDLLRNQSIYCTHSGLT
jgi:hypothetical protein